MDIGQPFLTKIVFLGLILDIKLGHLTPNYDADWYDTIVGCSRDTGNTFIIDLIDYLCKYEPWAAILDNNCVFRANFGPKLRL